MLLSNLWQISLSFIISFTVFLLFIIKVKTIFHSYKDNRKSSLSPYPYKKLLHSFALIALTIFFSIYQESTPLLPYQIGLFLGITFGIIEGVFYDNNR